MTFLVNLCIMYLYSVLGEFTVFTLILLSINDQLFLTPCVEFYTFQPIRIKNPLGGKCLLEGLFTDPVMMVSSNVCHAFLQDFSTAKCPSITSALLKIREGNLQ